MRRMLLSLLIVAPSLFAQDNPHCKQVGGAILTNFIDSTETLGTATGDLRGALGVTILKLTPGPNGSAVFHNHHQWVTESGDTIFFADADAAAYPTPAGVFGAKYTDGVQITGGTGQFAGASGQLAIYGAVDLTHGQIILRYSGQVCLKPVPAP